MRKYIALFGILLVLLAACSAKESTVTPIDASVLQTSAVQTVFAGVNQTATANAPTNTAVPTATATFAMTVNGQLQGILAFIRDDNLWVSINGVEAQLTTDAISSNTGLPKLWYSNPQISPDGTQVAYLKNTSDVSTYSYTRALIVSAIDGTNARQLTNNDIAWTLPVIQWSNDSQQIYYLVSNGFDTTTGLETMIVKSMNLTTGDLLEHGQFLLRVGCGGGSSDVADEVSGDEGIGRLGSGKTFALAPQKNYVIHPVTCDDGLGILDLSTHQDTMLDEQSISVAAISTDGLRIAAISGNNIVVFDATSGNVERTFLVVEPPRALLWDNNGTAIFYSTSKPVSSQDLDEALALEVFNRSSATITLNLSTLWRLSLDNGESIKITQMDAHDIKPIFATNQTILVAVVENANALFDYIIQGNRENITDHYPSVNLVEIDLVTMTSNVIKQKTIQADYFSTR